jgi:hypothetical protein
LFTIRNSANCLQFFIFIFLLTFRHLAGCRRLFEPIGELSAAG